MAASKPPKLDDCKRVLIVEGYSDLHFYAELLEWLDNNSGVYIQQMGGKGNVTGTARLNDLAVKIETFLNPSLLGVKESIGVIVDADLSAGNTSQSLKERLKKITGQDVAVGEWTAGPPRIGLFVVPGKDRAGELESLVWAAWAGDPNNAVAKTCIEGFLDCMKAGGHEAKSPDKGRLAALLSVLNDEDPRLGPGARARKFDFARPEFANLAAFLRAL